MTILAFADPSGSILYQFTEWLKEITAESALARFAVIMIAIFVILRLIAAFREGALKGKEKREHIEQAEFDIEQAQIERERARAEREEEEKRKERITYTYTDTD